VTWAREHLSAVACAAVIIGAAVLVAVVKLSGSPPGGPARSAPVRSTQQVRYFGVYEPDMPHSYAAADQFGRDVGRQPNLVAYYSGWGEGFQKTFAETAAIHGATTLVQMDPTDISLYEIAHGRYDSYLKSFAASVATLGHPVIISFGHEMNGNWYSWAYHHSSPADFIAAWRHIVTLFRQQGAENVRWLWVVNSNSAQTGPVHDWWPGSQYVTWVGVSGYYWLPNETFSYIFGRVVADIRRFTQDPVLIAETGVGPFRGRSTGIRNLFAGLRKDHYLGLVWFDRHSYGGVYKGENWRLEGKTLALATFRTALRAADDSS
jgi:hypothetical protein